MARTAKKSRGSFYVNGDEWQRPAASLHRAAKRSVRRTERRTDFLRAARDEEFADVMSEYDGLDISDTF